MDVTSTHLHSVLDSYVGMWVVRMVNTAMHFSRCHCTDSHLISMENRMRTMTSPWDPACKRCRVGSCGGSTYSSDPCECQKIRRSGFTARRFHLWRMTLCRLKGDIGIRCGHTSIRKQVAEASCTCSSNSRSCEVHCFPPIMY